MTCILGLTLPNDRAQALSRLKQHPVLKKILLACAACVALTLVIGLVSGLWLYKSWSLDAPAPRPAMHYVGDGTDALLIINVPAGNSPAAQLLELLLQSQDIQVPADALPESLTGKLAPGDTILDVPGVLPLDVVLLQYGGPEPEQDHAFATAAMPQLPMELRAAAAFAFKAFTEDLVQIDPGAVTNHNGSAVARIAEPETDGFELYASVINSSAFVAFSSNNVAQAIDLFRGDPAGGPGETLGSILQTADPSSNIVAGVRNDDGETTNRLLIKLQDRIGLRISSDPARFLDEETGIDLKTIKAMGLEAHFLTTDRARCRLFFLGANAYKAQNAATLVAVAIFVADYMNDEFNCAIKPVVMTGNIAQLEVEIDGIERCVRGLGGPPRPRPAPPVIRLP